MNEYGFYDTLRFDTEWNCCICDKDTPDYRTEYYINMRTNKGASHVAGSLYEMQRLNIDGAMFYDAQLWCEYGCLFNVPSLTPSKTYYAFRQFNEFYKLGNWVYSDSYNKIYSLAASGEYDMIGLTNITENAKMVKVYINNSRFDSADIYLLDENSNYEKTDELSICTCNNIELPPYSFVSIVLK